MPKTETTTIIPDHQRRDGTRCPWSGIDTHRADGACPDRCDATLSRLARYAIGGRRSVHVQISEVGNRVYLRTRDPRIIPSQAIHDAITRSPDLCLAGITPGDPPIYAARRYGEA